MKKTSKIIKRIAFFGDAQAKSTEEHFEDAYNVAALLAKNNYIVVNGGGPGVMLASTLGAKSAGGIVETVVLAVKNYPPNYEGSNEENIKSSDKVYTTQSYPDRLNKLVEIADAFIVFKGGTGTLSEIGLTWEMAKFDYGHHEPLFFYGSFWEPIIDDLVLNLNYEKKEKEVVTVVTSPEQIITLLKKITH